MLTPKAIVKVLSIVIVIVVISVAFLGYAVIATISQRPSAYTVTITASGRTNTITVTSNCCTDSNLSLSTPCNGSVTPAVQRLEYLVEANPEFTSAEHGLNYTTYFNGCGSVYSIGGNMPNGTYVYFTSTATIDKLYTDNCGDVWNFTYYLNVAVPLTETGYDISAIEITPTNSQEITVTCLTTS